MNLKRGRVFSDIRRVRGSFEEELKSMRVELTVNSTEPSQKARKTPEVQPATVKAQGGSSKGKRSCYESYGNPKLFIACDEECRVSTLKVTATSRKWPWCSLGTGNSKRCANL
jgi:hypothetical protein